MGDFGFNQGLIARRLFVQVVFLSLLATAVISALQIHFRYDDKLRAVENELQRIETSHLNSMATNLWHMDEALLRTELQGIMNLPNIQFVEVRSSEGRTIALGTPGTGDHLARQHPLVFSHRGVLTELGIFAIHADLNPIRSELMTDAAALSLGEAGKIFVIALLVFILFQFTVGRHLRNLTRQALDLDLGLPQSPFHLHRPPRKGKSADELEYLSSSLNGLYANLMATIESLRHTNEKLDQEIEERKKAEESLRRANLVVENSPVVVFRWQAVDGWPVDMVSQNVSQFGYTQEELLTGAVPFASLVHPDDLQRVGREIHDYAASGADRFQQIYRMIAKDGGVRWVDDRTVVERNDDGRIAFYQGIIIDITEQKLSEEALGFTQFAVDKTSDQAFWMTKDGHFFYVNDAACRTLGYPRRELLQLSVPDIGPMVPPEVFAAHWLDLQKNGSVTLETLHRAKDGRVYPVEIRANYVVFDGKEYNCAFARDITERKKTETALRSSLAEKESLLKEVHHRVKNNLQIVSSLLSLQGRKAKNPEALGFLQDAQNRVRSMALLHETLYRSGNLDKVSFPQYVKSICAHLARSCGSVAEGIHLRQDIADVALDIDQAIPAGLIISELVANAFKHAFPSRSEGEISVELQAAGEQHLVLRVSDNGVGFPAETRSQSSETLGLILVKNLSRQLDGQLSITSQQGSVFEIVFPAQAL